MVSAMAVPAAAAAQPYHLFNPVPASEMRPLSADRPDITESPFTVDAGHYQLEMTLYSFGRTELPLTIGEASGAGGLNLKAGITPNIDIQFVLEAWTQERVELKGAGRDTTISGNGDFALRLKLNLSGQDAGSPIAVALLPFVVFPTASNGLGVGETLYGLSVPIAFDTPDNVSAGIMVEGSRLEDVTNWLFTAALGGTLYRDLGGFVEFARSREVAVGGGPWVSVFNSGLTYGIGPDLQLDGGATFGLTEEAPDYEIFFGLTARR